VTAANAAGAMMSVGGSPAPRCEAHAPIMLMRIPAYAHSLRPESPGVTKAAAAGAVAAHAASFRWGAPFARPALVGGRAGLALARDDQVIGGLGFVVAGDRIVVVEVISDPAAVREL
jgi:hypothetical protein